MVVEKKLENIYKIFVQKICRKRNLLAVTAIKTVYKFIQWNAKRSTAQKVLLGKNDGRKMNDFFILLLKKN